MINLHFVYKTKIKDTNIENITIEKLYGQLYNLLSILNSIIVKESRNKFKRENKISYGCNLLIEKLIITKKDLMTLKKIMIMLIY